jgi:pSer/pThr/pTyr-binding forkhead associated (FHA) protein
VAAEDIRGGALMWILQSSEPPPKAFTFRVGPGAIKTVGRAPRADFIVEAPLVSRLHCRIEAGQDSLEVIDLSSTNGTFVNDKRVARAQLTIGDRLRVGRVELQIQKRGTDD